MSTTAGLATDLPGELDQVVPGESRSPPRGCPSPGHETERLEPAAAQQRLCAPHVAGERTRALPHLDRALVAPGPVQHVGVEVVVVGQVVRSGCRGTQSSTARSPSSSARSRSPPRRASREPGSRRASAAGDRRSRVTERLGGAGSASWADRERLGVALGPERGRGRRTDQRVEAFLPLRARGAARRARPPPARSPEIERREREPALQTDLPAQGGRRPPVRAAFE